MISGVTVIGFISYLLLGLSAFDAIYMTVITITTVDFSEIGAPEEITAAYQAFTLLLALFGVGTALYTLGVSFEALVEGSINDGLKIRRGLRMIDKKSNHIIVVGNGRVGQAIVHYVGRHGAEVVMVDRTPTRQRLACRHRRSHRGRDPAQRRHRAGDDPHRRARL